MAAKRVFSHLLFVFVILFNLVATVGPTGVLPAQAATSSIWTGPITPTFPFYDNPQAIEVGLKFRTDIDGYVTGVRYFKGPGATGTRVGRLWTLGGIKLAEVTFTNETTSGWQSATFPEPAFIQANTTYIISYYVADGNRRLSISQNFFTTSGVTNGHLTAIANNDLDGPNGAFSETGEFFNQNHLSSNYWVDLIFEDTPDTVPPTVSEVSPIDGAAEVLAGTDITAVFSEAIDASTINMSSFVLHDAGGSLVAASVSYDRSSYTAVLDPASNLTFTSAYSATVKGGDSGVKDAAGNPLAGDYSWSFTIEASDTTPPNVSSISPANGATEVPISSHVSAVFTEAMDPTTITTTNFELLDPYNVVVPADVTYDAGTNTATLDPADLTYGTLYTGRIRSGTDGVKDLGGNALAADHVWTFTTTTPPTVNSVSPSANAVDVLITSDVSAVFSKPMDGNTINSATFELRGPSDNLLPASVTYNSASRTAVLNPNANLGYSSVYTAIVKGGSAGVRDLVGNPLDTDFTWTFTTESMDTTPPTVTSVKPIDGVSRLRLATKATVTFSRAMEPDTINDATFELRAAAGTLVPANITYNTADHSAVLDPVSDLDYSTTYTARIIGGADGAKDKNGIAMDAAGYAWSFTTIAQRPPVDQAPGGPILVIASPTNLFTRYYVEIIRTEGFNAFALMDIGNITPETLSGYDLVILGEMPLNPAQVTMLTDWVTSGGHLVAMRPDKQLTGLLGLTDAATTLSDAYLRVDTGAGAGAGIVDQTLQFHGMADLYTLSGATSLATLYSNASTSTPYPAVTVRSVGTDGGQAAAFTYDLARSIVYTHQGNPAWQNRHVNGYQGYGTALDLFDGTGGEPNWIDFSKITIPQADEQQRFLANLLLELNNDEKPLPRFWYFPSGKKAVIILTGDDHIGRGSPSGSSQIFFDRHISQSPTGCSVEDWECVRSSSYGYVGNTISDATYAAYTAQGFEFGLHADAGLASGGGWCGTWPADMMARFTAQYDALFDKYASLPVQSSERNHCYSWFGYDGPAGWVPYTSTPEGNEAQGIRLDTNISYNPGSWATVNPGYQMGSGMLMRFAQVDSTGVMHRTMDIYNGGTQMNDDNGQGAAAMRTIVDSYLDSAIGPQGYYGAFVVNMHSDNWYGWSYAGSDQIVASAQARGIPVVSGAQMVEWLDGRNSSYFSDITLAGDTLSFNIFPAQGARNLQAMLPTQFGGNPLSVLVQDGTPIQYRLETIKGVEYAIFDAEAGSYSATYTPDTYPPAITSPVAEPALGGEAEITWVTNEDSTSRVIFGTDPDNLWLSTTTSGLATNHSVQLVGLLPHTIYYYRVMSSDESDNTAVYPETGTAPARFTTPSAAFIDTTVSDFSAGSLDGNIAVSHLDNGEVMLKSAVYEEFNGTTLPAGWDDFFGMPGATGSVHVSGGLLTVDGANAGTTALFGPGHVVEFTAAFTAAPNQHAGFGVDHTARAGDAWAIISTGQSGSQLYARSYNGAAPWDTASTPIPGNYFGTPHRYRVDWQANQIIYSIDGNVVATHNVSITTLMRPLVSEGTAGGASFSVDQLQMGPFPTSGQFTSRVLDSMGSITDGSIAWDAVLTENASLELSVRTGNTPNPDVTWSDFVPVQNGDSIGSGFRYVQYQANFATTDTAVTPLLQEVRIPYNTTPDTAAPQITSREPVPGAENVYSDAEVTVTFNEPMQPGSITASTFRLSEVGSNIDVSADVSYSGLTATLHPLAPLTPRRQYQVTVAGTVADQSGNPLGTDDIWTFTVIQLPGPPWMDTDWAYRRAVTIASTCAQVQTDYPVKIVLDGAFNYANAKPDGSDLRVTLLDGFTAIPFWVESWSVNRAVLWVKLSTLPLEPVGLYLYYGNPAAISLSSAAGVFSFSDDFSGTSLDATKWTITNGTPPLATFANGVMTLTTTSPYSKINSIPVFGQGYMVEALMRHPQAGTNGLISEVGFATTFPNSLRILDDFPDTAHWQWIADAPGLNSGVNSMTQTALNTGWNYYRIGRVAGMASFQVNDWAPSTTTSNLPTANLSAFLMSYGSGNQAQVDWLNVRKWCGSESSALVGDEEPLNIPPLAASDSYTSAEDITLTVPTPGILSNDDDGNGDLLTAEGVTIPTHGTLALNPDGSFTYSPALNWNGIDSFTYKANDGTIDSIIATVTITVNPVNDAPVLEPIGSFTIDLEETLTFNAAAFDVETPDNLTFRLDGGPEDAAIDPDTGAFTWTPAEAHTTGIHFNVCADDGELTDCEPVNVTVNKADQLITFNPLADKVYGAEDFFVNATASSGLEVSFVSAGNCTITGNLVHISGAGSCTITSAQGGDANYIPADPVSQAFMITPATLTVTSNPQSKIYGETFTFLGTEFTAVGLVNGDAVSSVTLVSGGAAAAAEVGSYAITPSAAVGTGLTNYDIAYQTGTLTVDRKAASVTPEAQSKVYGELDPTLTGTLSGFLAADQVTAAYHRTPGETVADPGYTIWASLSPVEALENYTITYHTAHLTITPRPVEVTADAGQAKVYGEGDPTAFAFSITNGSLVTGDAFTGTLARAGGEAVGMYAIQQGSLALNDNYTLSYVGADFAVTPRPVTVTADAQSKTYGDADPELTYRITTGSLAFDDAFSGALTREAGEAVGAYAIQQGSLTLSSNYTFTYVGASLTIGTRPLTVTADPQVKVFGDADPILAYRITAGSLAAGESFSGTLSRAVGEHVGTYAIGQGTLSAGANYALAFTGADLTITPRRLAVVAVAKGKTYGQGDPELTYQATGFQFGDTAATVLTGSLIRAVGEDVGDYAVTQGTLAANADYTIVFTGNQLSIRPAALTVTADPQLKVYGTLDPALTYQVSGLQFTDQAANVLSGALARDPGEDVGTYAIQQGTLAANANYRITYIPATLAISQAELTVTADDQAITYGDSDPAFTYRYTGFKFSDGATVVDTAPACGVIDDHKDARTYPIVCAGGQDNNYAFVYLPAELTVYPKAVAVAANAQNKIYGDPDPTLTYTFTPPLVSGDSFSGSLTRVGGEAVGVYAIGQGTLALSSNYTLYFGGATLTVTPRPVTVTADARSKTYGDADPELTYRITTGSLAFDDTFAGSLVREAGEAVGTYAIQQGTLALSSNYALTYLGADLTITPAGTTTVVSCPVSEVYTGLEIEPCTVSVTGANLSLTPDPVYSDNINVGTATASYTYSGDANHAGSSHSATFEITKAESTVKVSCTDSVTYTGSAITPCTAAVIGAGGLEEILPVTYTENINAGTATATATYAGDANHEGSSDTAAFTIDKAPSTVSVTCPDSMVYTGSALEPCSAAVTGVGGLDQALTVTYETNMNAGTATASATFTGDGNHEGSTDTATFQITQALLTVTANPQSKVYGEAIPTLTFAYSGFKGTEDASVLDSAPSCMTTATQNSHVGDYPITCSGGLDNNYTFTYVDSTLTITQRAITVTADPQTKVYGGADPALTYQVTSGSLAFEDAFTGALTRVVGEDVGMYAIQQGTLALSSNYALSYAGAGLTITPKAATVTAEDKNKTYGDDNPALTSTVVGAVDGGDPIHYTLSTAVEKFSNVGEYPIVVTLGANPNYDVTPVNGTLAITRKAATVTADDKSKVYGEANPLLTAVVNGEVVGGDAINYTLSTTATKLSGVDKYPIEVTLSSNPNYTVTKTDGTLTITPAGLTITAENKTKQYSDPIPDFTVTYTGFVNSDDWGDLTGILSCTTTAMMLSGPGRYPISCSGLSSDNYTITFVSGTLTVNPEDARAYYTGNSLFWGATISATSANVTLSATIKDITAELDDPAYDSYAGDIQNARVSFVNRDASNKPLEGCSNLQVALVSSGDLTTGTVACNTQLAISISGGSPYNIGIIVKNYYTDDTSEEDFVVTVAQPLTTNFITGGGYLMLSSSAGQYTGTSGSKAHFGFNIKYNKKGTNLQGNVNILIRSGGKVYQIKSNSLQSLGVNPPLCAQATPSKPCTANFISKANLIDITDPNNPIGQGGNLTLQMQITDKGEPGSNDTISFTLWDGSKLLFSSNWSGTWTLEQLLKGGNLVVH